MTKILHTFGLPGSRMIWRMVDIPNWFAWLIIYKPTTIIFALRYSNMAKENPPLTHDFFPFNLPCLGHFPYPMVFQWLSQVYRNPFWASACLLQQAVDRLNDGRLRAVGRLVGSLEFHAEDGQTHGVQGQVQVETLHVHHLVMIAVVEWTCVVEYVYKM